MPTVSIIGGGRLGTALGKALTDAGYEVAAIVNRRLAHAKKSAAMIAPATLSLSTKQLSQLPPTTITLIATPDDEIAATAAHLAANVQFVNRKRQTVLHTSGALSSTVVLSPLVTKGIAIGSLHPLVSISDPMAGATKFKGAYYCLEGDAAATRVARAIVRDLGGHSFHIASEKKPLYHAAAVMSSGHVTALFDLAIVMLNACGLDRKTAQLVLLPLLESAVTNLRGSDPAAALTGTFARGDLATVKKHLASLSGSEFTAAREAYKLLGRHSLDLVRRRIAPETWKQIQRLLK